MLRTSAFGLLILFALSSTCSCGNQPVSAPATNIREKEQELVLLYQKTTDLKLEYSDSLDYYSSLFSSKMQALLSDESTLNYPFDQLKEVGCNIVTSKDGYFRIYSWDSYLGGTMRFFDVIYQYKTGKTVKTQLYQSDFEGDPVWYCSDIFTLETQKNTYYLAIINGIYSSKDISQSIKAFELTNHGLNDSIPLMKTSEGLKNSLRVDFDFFSVVDRPERPVAVIQYNPDKQTISLSETNEKYEIIASTQTYRFNGSYFEAEKK